MESQKSLTQPKQPAIFILQKTRFNRPIIKPRVVLYQTFKEKYISFRRKDRGSTAMNVCGVYIVMKERWEWCILPCVNFGKTLSKGDGSVCSGLVGGVDGDKVIGIHLRRFGVLCDGL